ncbi:hypothetical protein ACIBTV_27465 [Micromonospora sp. NPDC049366]|uniref:hypothetical protein n=1 Tax=Micromonospora sp. NPDC049366 TaxID=3364271 RepID=UPI0037AF9AA2
MSSTPAGLDTPPAAHRDGSTTLATKPTTDGIRPTVYAAMRAAITTNGGFIYRGGDHQTGPQASRGTLIHLEKWGWARLVRVTVTIRGQRRREIAGGWLLPMGRTVLRDEILRRGDDMPARLARPARRPAPRPVTPAPAPRRPATTARPLLGAAACASRPATPAPARPRRSLTAQIDAFALIGTGAPAEIDISF